MRNDPKHHYNQNRPRKNVNTTKNRQSLSLITVLFDSALVKENKHPSGVKFDHQQLGNKPSEMKGLVESLGLWMSRRLRVFLSSNSSMKSGRVDTLCSLHVRRAICDVGIPQP